MYILILIFAFSPIIVATLAGFLGSCLGCNINEGGTDPCYRLGIPLGIILSAFFTMGWFMLITIPLGAIAIVAWTIFCIIIWLKKMNTKS